MAEPTLEEIVTRLEAVEMQLAEQAAAKKTRKKDWRRVVGMSQDNEFTRQMQKEIEANREAEREAARRRDEDEPHIVE